jgi:hypothetical protein
MATNLVKISEALDRNSLKQTLKFRRSELLARLQKGGAVVIKDSTGRTIKFTKKGDR